MISLFPTVTATLIRYGSASNIDGRWELPEPVESVISIVRPQPITGKEMMLLPEGELVRRHEKTWTATEVRTKESSTRPDQIRTIEGITYDVVVSQYWGDGPHYKLILKENR